MLRLIIMRHAKSDWQSGAQRDHERPLNKRGRRDAPRMGKHLLDCGWSPDMVISSDAQRTRETWAGMSEFFPRTAVHFLNAFYLAGITAIETEVGRLALDAQTVLVLGHNPGWEDAASELSGISIGMTTANVVLLQTNVSSWSQAFGSARQFQLEAIVRPRELDG